MKPLFFMHRLVRRARVLRQLRRDARFVPEHPDARINALLTQIHQHGWAMLPAYFSPDWCEQACTQLQAAFSVHAAAVRHGADARLFGVEHASACAAAFAGDRFLQALSDAYHGAPSKLGTCLASRLESGGQHMLGSGGDWHRDSSHRQLKALVYLSDVGEENGPFELIERSSTAHGEQLRADMRAMGRSLEQRRYDAKAVGALTQKDAQRLKSFTAPKGTVILADTSSIHRGKPLVKGIRTVLFNYYYPAGWSNEWIARKFRPITGAHG